MKKPFALENKPEPTSAFSKPSTSASPPKPSVPSSPSVKPSASTTTAKSSESSAPLPNGTLAKGAVDKEAGVAFAERFRRMAEEELLDQDVEQFGRNLWEEHVLKISRERDELRMLRRSDKEQMRKLCEDEFRSDLTIILKWAMVSG
ncbi:unnamed protein product [Nippostrongylus brasiliensis]|uniref:NAM-associated domain-containing protein n=2 Tax=Nippostrongylus brasiliensis TaxID=27835 RepID=A0A0N4YS86_NIPBR|nr:unnamed protein product [Nippostrongylus brasiliensis]